MGEAQSVRAAHRFATFPRGPAFWGFEGDRALSATARLLRLFVPLSTNSARETLVLLPEHVAPLAICMQLMLLQEAFFGAPHMMMLGIFALSTIQRPITRQCVLIYFALAVTACFALPVDISAAEPRQRGVRSMQLVQHEPGVMAVYSVVLDRRFDTGELDTLSRSIKRNAPKTKLILISYFLRGMQPAQAAWATSHFNPDLDSFLVRINESTTVSNPPDSDLRVAGGR
jgi:hypothetical protein